MKWNPFTLEDPMNLHRVTFQTISINCYDVVELSYPDYKIAKLNWFVEALWAKNYPLVSSIYEPFEHNPNELNFSVLSPIVRN